MLGLILLLSACRDTPPPTNHSTEPIPANVNQPADVAQANGTFNEYHVPQDKSGLMRPAVDRTGRVWFGEMGQNYLASFEPESKKFTQIHPPHGQAGIMGLIVAPDDTIWFAEQYADYIGHYDPRTRHFTTYSLPQVTTPDPSNPKQTLSLPSAPNELVMDQQGNIWFTEMNADSIGKLEVKTGRFTHYPLSNPRTVQKLSPYGITLDKNGTIWFTQSGESKLGRLDPSTGAIHVYTPPASAQQTSVLMEVHSDPAGMIWLTTFNTNDLLQFDPHKASFTAYAVPLTGHGIQGIYGLIATSANDIWATVAVSNAIAHLNVHTKTFTYYPIPTENCTPLGISQGPDKSFWFTESATNQLGQLIP
ncbi:hypothetical protein KDA_03300 [Dictyobacter alpinus]|uniref:Uncharacterized protein n=2 Tax=Dictyobacter alpinus TaxID=2014873 RepID=A0A402B0H2_9CHLR|nr:hypothetical protein KDA_03300 [Dictyobacter alpinus]